MNRSKLPRTGEGICTTHFRHARHDAADLLPLIETKAATVREIRAMLPVSEKDKVALRKILAADLVEKLAEYRLEVLREFDSMVRKGVKRRVFASQEATDREKRKVQLRVIETRQKRGEDFSTIALALAISKRIVIERTRELAFG